MTAVADRTSAHFPLPLNVGSSPPRKKVALVSWFTVVFSRCCKFLAGVIEVSYTCALRSCRAFQVDNIITEPNLTATTFVMFGTREDLARSDFVPRPREHLSRSGSSGYLSTQMGRPQNPSKTRIRPESS